MVRSRVLRGAWSAESDKRQLVSTSSQAKLSEMLTAFD